MYETEVNDATEPIESLPQDIRRRFAEYRDRIVSRTILPWGEHCTECAWPTCYTTCELYSPRKDGACRQFLDGMVRIDHKEGLSPYLLKIRFRQWAKLWTVGNIQLRSLPAADRQEHFQIAVGAISQKAPLPAAIKPRVLQKINYLRRRSAENAGVGEESPDCFLLECYNPNPNTIALSFTVRLRNQPGTQPFQKMLSVASGYTRAKVPFSEIAQVVDTRQPFDLEIVPNDCENLTLYFGLMDFVKERPQVKEQAQPAAGNGARGETNKCKCIVWDLDHTLWDGILIEDGPEGIRLRQNVVDIIKQLDQRGILHSIASKNNHDDAMRVLRLCGIDDLFLYPQIKWEPKSQSIAEIAHLLNIGVDTLAFVDDQSFEREEVKAVLPKVTVIDAAQCDGILDRPEFRVPVTAESKSRRLMYREQQTRDTAQETYKGDYIAFLRDCRIEAVIRPLDDTNIERVYELAQRTNQLNFSGNRYPRTRLTEIMRSDFIETYVIDCADRFGKYGIVGFAVVDTREPRLQDLMFSCRVQAKRVEHAILGFLLKRFVAGGGRDFFADYRKTAKNAPGGRVFEEVGFDCVEEKDGVLSLVFRKDGEIADDQVIKIITPGVL